MPGSARSANAKYRAEAERAVLTSAVPTRPPTADAAPADEAVDSASPATAVPRRLTSSPP
jgi:hypothetical protein